MFVFMLCIPVEAKHVRRDAFDELGQLLVEHGELGTNLSVIRAHESYCTLVFTNKSVKRHNNQLELERGHG